MPNYRFIGLTPRFYPDERGADGRSLMALPGMVRDWDRTPDDGLWAIVEDAPEPAQEAFQPEPVPEPPAGPPVAPEPPVAAPEVVPVPAPEPVPEPVQPALTADWFSALAGPPVRA